MSIQDIILFIIKLLGGAGVFLVGVKLLSTNIEQLATKGIKDLFSKTSKNKVLNIGIGALTTALVQSSGVTTVLIVGFVNVGIMNLYQAAAMIMGANIGTTLTAQIAALATFDVDKYIQFISFVGIMITMVSKKDKIKKIGYVIAGFGLIFIGLSLMSGSIGDIKDQIGGFFTSITNPFLLFFIGIFLTALVQSSAAVTSIIISIAVAGLTIGKPGDNSVLFIILGTNIGSCVTALISSIGSSPNARRTSLMHLLFNTVGSVIFFMVLILWPSFTSQTFGKWFKEEATQIAMFHTFFNVICTIMFAPFTKVLVKIVTFLVHDNDTEEVVTYLDDRMLGNTALAIDQVNKEIMRLSDIAMDAFRIAYRSFHNKDDIDLDDSQKKIEEANKLSKSIIDYIIRISAEGSLPEEKEISDLYNNIGDVMRIAEIADNFIKYTNKEIERDLVFSDTVIKQTEIMVEKIERLHKLTKDIVLTGNLKLLKEINFVEDSIDVMRKELVDGHIDRLNKGECKPECSSIFINLVSNLERLGDHLTYIADTVKK